MVCSLDVLIAVCKHMQLLKMLSNFIFNAQFCSLLFKHLDYKTLFCEAKVAQISFEGFLLNKLLHLKDNQKKLFCFM